METMHFEYHENNTFYSYRTQKESKGIYARTMWKLTKESTVLNSNIVHHYSTNTAVHGNYDAIDTNLTNAIQ